MKRILTYYLLINTLLASLYVPVIIHKCNLFDSTTTALFIAPECCEIASNDSENLDVDCCSQSNSTYSAKLVGVNLEQELTLDGHRLEPLEFPTFAALNHCLLDAECLKNRPPPRELYNCTLLVSYQTFLI